MRSGPWLSLAALLNVVPATAQNLVTNGDFEAGLAPWARSHESSPDAVRIVPRDDAGQCVQLVSDGEWVDLGQAASLPEGQRAVFQMDLKRTAGGPDIRAFLIAKRKNGQEAYYSLGGEQTDLNEWQHFASVIAPPGDMASARVLLMNRLEGAEAWFDRVELVPVGTASGPAPDYTPKLAIPSTKTPPSIDGRIEDAEWAEAAAITGFVRIADGSEPEAQTRAWVCHDGSRLLIAARCEEPLMAEGRFGVTGHDAGGVFSDEVVEILIDPDNDHQTYYHFAIGGAGADYDASNGEGRVDGVAFDSGWTAKAHRAADHWSIEAAIPLASLTSGSPGDIWGFNVCRERHVPNHRENTAWSATGPRFHAPHRFGDLVGLAGVVKQAVLVSVTGVDELTPGPAKLGVEAASALEPRARVRVIADVASPSGDASRSQREVELPAGATRNVSLPFEITGRGDWQVVVRCVSVPDEQPLSAATTYRFTVPPLLTARVVRPWFRGRIYSKMNLREVEIEARIGLRDAARQGLSIAAELSDPDGVKLSEEFPVTGPVTTVALPCGSLQPGRYEVRLQLSSGSGEKLASVEGLAVEKLPPADDELWFDRNSNLVVNGTPHFPTGFYSVDWAGRMNLLPEGGYTFFHTYASSRPRRLDPETSDWDWQDWLDTGAGHGLRSFMGIGYQGDGEESFQAKLAAGELPEAEGRIKGFIERWKQHPAIGAWYLYDEPSLAGRTPDEMRYLYELVDDIDPYHPKVVCQVYWSDARFVPWLDVLMPDRYPVRGEGSQPLRSVASAVRSARATVQDEKPVWAVLQWYRYEGGRFPTPREMRCMAFLALAAGAKGILWYGFYQGYKNDSAHWPDVAALGRELRSVEDVVLASAPDTEVAVEPADAPIEVLVKQSAAGIHLLAVNSEDRALPDVRFSLPARIAEASERLRGKPLTVDAKSVTVSFDAYEPVVIDVQSGR
jgi:hypothetical protein